MSELNKKNINYGGLYRFLQNLRSHDLSGLATEKYVDNAIGSIKFPEYSAGSNISISNNREISCTYQYTLPTASNSTKGGVKVGSGLSINNDVLSTNISEEEVDAISNSVIDINKEVRYLTPLNEQYLTFEAVTECTIKFICNTSNSTYFKTIEVSKDKLTWTSVTSSYYDSYSAPSGGTLIANLLPTEKIYLRGNNNAYTEYSSGNEFVNKFKVDGEFNIYGNIMSLVSTSNFSAITALTNEYVFKNLFEGCEKLIDASDLLLPATTLSNSCYNSMFYGCANLTKAPELPAETLSASAYQYMFYGCVKLNHIKCLATDISADMCTYGWVRDVAISGIFEKNPSMSSWTTGNNGIPSGWTSQDYVKPNYPATKNYVDEKVSTKANKVDYVVQLNPSTLQYDWTSLNSVTETGVYRISIEANMMGTVMKMGTGDLFVSNTAPTIIQSILIPGDDSISLHVRKSTNSGSSWTDSDMPVPSINDGATTSTTETYSVTKINSLISALEARIAALEGK